MQVIYIRVEDLSSGSVATTSVNLVVNLTPETTVISDYEICEINSDLLEGSL